MGDYKVRDYVLRTGNGKKIRKATKVYCPDGSCIRFTEKMSQKNTIKQAQHQKNKTNTNKILFG